ncbi:hypothetical protein [Leyella lascolaii]|jgi:hypothetical protein|uniref:Uncharacterized protein n=1 Tax=Leyella lascolaii TaxID=1776379 RepID=A0AAW7JSJ9_9BACT|nr:hypothetical protein [Leyella lascolaii]MDN0022291.1 hypothetical protein [Leyella lascolaii]MDN0024890.1 hypothetical protein [Leyella lascolaii]
MSIEKFINRLKYGFFTIESIETRAERRIGFTTHGLICGTICNLLSIIGLKYMISLGVVPLCTIVLAAFFLDLYIMYIIDKKYLDEELFEMYMPVFKRESFVRKTLWAVSAYALLAVVFVYVTVSIGLFFMS